MLRKCLIFLLAALFSRAAFASEAPSRIITTQAYILYIPSGIDYQQKYPLVITLSPSADAQGMIDFWKEVSEKYKWLILASKDFRNGANMEQIFANLSNNMNIIFLNYPADKRKVIATGMSGGGMGAHAFAYTHPNLIRATIINTGMMHEYYIEKKYRYPKNKIAVFLASPADFRYQEMRRDKNFLEALGWQIKWIEFEGGHAMAPVSLYIEAAQWIQEQLDLPERN